MSENIVIEFLIRGITSQGKMFRPSDWSERLCGVMSSFGPPVKGPNARLRYSQFVKPVTIEQVKCVVVNEALREIDPIAFDFVINFAKDNDLQIEEACLVSDGVKIGKTK